MHFISEIGIWRASQYGDGLAHRLAAAKRQAFVIKRRQKGGNRLRRGKIDRLARKRYIEAVQVDQYGQPDAGVLGDLEGHEGCIQGFLAVGGMKLKETAVPCGKHIIMIGLQRNRRG